MGNFLSPKKGVHMHKTDDFQNIQASATCSYNTRMFQTLDECRNSDLLNSFN